MATALANDTLATLGAGGLVPVRSTEISIEREDLEISAALVKVRYVFRNRSDRDVESVVAFPLPELEGGTVEHVPLRLPSQGKLNFVDFEVRIAGRPVAVQTEVRAFHEGREVTDRLRAAGLPVSVIDPEFAAAVKRLSAARMAELRKDELVVTDDPSNTTSPRYWANWTTKVQFYWTQRFPAKGTLEVEHRYRPVVGGTYMTTAESGAELIRQYCGRGRVKPGSEIEKRIQYVLTTANNWRGPIGDFRMVITGSPRDTVFSCFPGLKRLGPGRYEAVRSGFRPEKDLEVLILTNPLY